MADAKELLQFFNHIRVLQDPEQNKIEQFQFPLRGNIHLDKKSFKSREKIHWTKIILFAKT